MMDVPLLSQDEFFRHLNLQSVHQAAAKFHYRHALKERLRASSIALRKERAEKLSPEKLTSVVEAASPCHLLSPTSSNRLFGRPVIRREVRALNFDDYPLATSATTTSNSSFEKSEVLNGIKSIGKPSILKPLIADSRVFRHPGIKREIEERTKMNGFLHHYPPSNHFPIDDVPPKKRAKIEVRYCYYPKQVEPKKEEKVPKEKEHCMSFRLQSTSSSEAVEWERKMAAALTLFGHPRKSDVFSTLPYLVTANGVRHKGSNSVSSSNGKRSPSLPPTSHCDAHKLPLHNGNNNNYDRCKDLKLCLTRINNARSCSGGTNNALRLSPTVKLEKLSLFPLQTKSADDVVNSKNATIPIIPRGSRPLLHRKAKDEPPAKPTPPTTEATPSITPLAAVKRKLEEVPENSFVCPICQKCFSTGQTLMLHGEQAHLRCQFCGIADNSLWKRGMDDLDTCQTCRAKRRSESKTSVTPIVTRQHQQAAMSTLEMIEKALKGDSAKRGASDKCHKCDICNKVFDRRSRMIRHITGCHASDIHKVDLSKFAYNKKLVQTELGVC